MGHDELAAAYQHYRVDSARYSIRLSNNTSTNIYVFLRFEGVEHLWGTLEKELENSGNIVRYIPRASGVPTNNPSIHIFGRKRCAAAAGMTEVKYKAKSSSAAALTSNPLDTIWLQIGLYSARGTAWPAGSDIRMTTRLQQTVTCWDPIPIGQS